MKPKMYRKGKKSKGSDIASFKNNAGGGPVKFVEGPDTSVGQKSGATISKAHVEDGGKKVVGAKS
jgi:hypothetical protein